MALSTFNDIKASIVKWAERSDISDDQIKDFLYMSEADASQQLRVPAMEAQLLLTVTDGRVTIPFDYLELRRLTFEGSFETTLQYLPWDQFVAENRITTGAPRFFSRQGPNWFISGEPSDGSVILCHYYRFVPELTADIPTNWLLTVSPQCYLFGGLKYLYEFTMDNERAAYWDAKFTKELNKLQAIADLAEHRGSSLSVKNIS
jgi:hypothetical protein